MTGNTIPHYWIINKIGVGAMGIVYEANEFRPNPEIMVEKTNMVRGK